MILHNSNCKRCGIKYFDYNPSNLCAICSQFHSVDVNTIAETCEYYNRLPMFSNNKIEFSFIETTEHKIILLTEFFNESIDSRKYMNLGYNLDVRTAFNTLRQSADAMLFALLNSEKLNSRVSVEE